MTPLLAVQSVKIKLERQRSVVVGNYEYYYCCGLYAAKNPQLGLTGLMQPKELKDITQPTLDESTFTPADDPDKYLKFLLHRYRPIEDEYNEVMAGLFTWGETGENPFRD